MEVVVEVGMGDSEMEPYRVVQVGTIVAKIWTGARRTTTSTKKLRKILGKKDHVVGTMRAGRLGRQRAEGHLFIESAYYMTGIVSCRLEAIPKP